MRRTARALADHVYGRYLSKSRTPEIKKPESNVPAGSGLGRSRMLRDRQQADEEERWCCRVFGECCAHVMCSCGCLGG